MRWRNVPTAQPTSSTALRRVERGVSADDAVLGDVELVHAVLDERRQQAPVPLLAVRDVRVVVVLADVVERHARVLIDEAAAAAGDEVERAGLAGEVVLALMNGSLSPLPQR